MECLKSLTCKECGGEIENNACMHCGAKNFTINEISNLIKTDDINGYYQDRIRAKITEGQYLDKIEDEVFSILLKNDLIKDEALDDAKILSFIINDRKIISYDTFKLLMLRSAEKSMRQINNNRIKKYTPYAIIKKLDGANGSAFNINNVNFNELIIKQLYEGYIYPLITYYHELVHIMQNIEITLGHVSYDLVTMIKEKIISDYKLNNSITNRRYYKQNYYNISYEVDAHLKSVEMIKYFMEYLGYKGLDNYFNKIRRIWSESNNNLVRIITGKDGEKIKTVDEIFDEIVSPDYLVLYPQLNFEYINKNGSVRKRTKDELSDIMINYMDNEEILAYLQKLINKKDEKKEQRKR